MKSEVALRRIGHEYAGTSAVVVAPGFAIQSLLGTALTGRAAGGRRFAARSGALAELEVWADGGGVLGMFNSLPADLRHRGLSAAMPRDRCRIAIIQDAEDHDAGEPGHRFTCGCVDVGLGALRIESLYAANPKSYLTAREILGRTPRLVIEPGLDRRVDATANGLRTTLHMPTLRAAFARICCENLGRTVAVVAQRWVARSLICHTAEIDGCAVARIATMPVAVNLVEVDGSGRGIVVSVNYVHVR